MTRFPEANSVYNRLGGNNLATQDQPDSHGAGAKPFERLSAALALAPIGIQQPRPSKRRSGRWRSGWRWWTEALRLSTS